MKGFKRNLVSFTAFVMLSVSAQSAVSVIENHTDVDCYIDSTGSIDITAFDGVAPYIYFWNDSVIAEDRSGLIAGTYSVTVTDGTLATTTLSVTITEPSQLTVVLNAIGVSCHSGSNGAINTNPGGGNGPYSYIWNDGAFTKNRTGLSAATYAVTVTDLNGCTVSDSIFVPQPAFAVTVTAIPSPLACLGGPSGSVVANASGGTPPYTYWWGGAYVDSFRINLFSGTYCVTASDSRGCPAIACATVPAYTPLGISSTQINNICYYDSTGSVDLTVSNGTTPYSFLWSIGSVAEDLTDLKAGNYDVTVTDNNACTISHSVTISQPFFPITINSTVADLTCFGTNDGSVAISVLNGIAPYTYTWQDGATAQNRTALTPGNYSVTITDNNLCTASTSVTVVEPTQLVIVPSVIDVACFGESTGVINLAVTGSFAPYSYTWSNGGDTQNNSNLPAGNDTILIVDNHGCTASASATVNQPSAPVTIAALTGDATCFGGTDGWINLSVTGGTPSYTYDWGGGFVSPNRNNLTAGTYTVTVIDNAGCAYYSTSVINEPAALLISSVVTNVTCSGWNNGAINLNVSGGTAPFAFDWGNSISSQNRTGLIEGSYTVTVSDAFGCSAIHTTTVLQLSQLGISASPTSVTCNGLSNGSIAVTVSAGISPFSFLWNDGTPTQNRSSIHAGTYSVIVTDANTCTAAASVIVGEPAPLVASTTVVNPKCFGSSDGSIDLSVSGGVGGYLYSWSNSSITEDLTNVPDGNYLVNITDLNNCVVSTSATLIQPASIILTTAQTNVGCSSPNSGSIDLTVNGGTYPYTFSWSNTSTTEDISSLAIGNYSVVVTDTNFCSATAMVSIVPVSPIILNISTVNVSCNGLNDGNIDITASGGIPPFTYNWNGGIAGPIRTNLSPGMYTVTVEDNAACSAVISVSITQPNVLSLVVNKTDVACSGDSTGSIDLNVVGGNSGYTYLWNDSSVTQDLSGLVAGSYSVIVTDSKSCSASTSVTVIQSPAIQTTLSKVDLSCFGSNNGSIDLSVINGVSPYSYLWSNASLTQDISSISAGNYSVVVTDANNCSATNSVTINQPSAIQVNSAVTPVSCYGGSNGKIDLTVNGGASAYNYVWNNLSVIEDISSLVSGNYAVTITDADGCSVAFQNMVVTQPAQLNVISNVVPISCANHTNGGIDLNVTGGVTPYTFEWSNQFSSRSISNLDIGNYSATVTDYNGCSASITENIGIASPIVLTSSTHNTACAQVQTGSIDLTVNGGTPSYSFNWSNGSNNEDISNLSEGTYSLTVTDSRDCSTQANFIISIDYDLQLSVASNVSAIKAGDIIELTATPSVDHGNIYSWSTPQNIICTSCSSTVEVTPRENTTYTVTIIDQNGCMATDAISLMVNSVNDIFIPNVFTPNNDGTNDVFEVRGDLEGIMFLDFSVFNRWGEQVYESTDHHFKWDGVYKGEILQQGAYVYRMKVVFSNGDSRDHSGSITVLR